MEYSSKPRQRTTSQSTSIGHDAPILRPRSSMASVHSQGYGWPHFDSQMHYLISCSAVLMLGPLTFSLLSHEGITSCSNMRRIGSKRRLRVQRGQIRPLACTVYQIDAKVFLPLLHCIPTSTETQLGIRLSGQILHGAGCGG
jgi:hypothetical protein